MSDFYWHFSDGILSKRPLDALGCRRGCIVGLCELRGDIQHFGDKSVARGYRVVSRADATEVLHRFAIWCAARALRRGQVTDPRCWHALRVKSRWIVGRATDGELKDARDAAYAVCGIRAATAATATAATAAAYAAAYGAAYAAAYAAAIDTAYAATDAYADEREMQNAYLEKRLLKLLERNKNAAD